MHSPIATIHGLLSATKRRLDRTRRNLNTFIHYPEHCLPEPKQTMRFRTAALRRKSGRLCEEEIKLAPLFM